MQFLTRLVCGFLLVALGSASATAQEFSAVISVSPGGEWAPLNLTIGTHPSATDEADATLDERAPPFFGLNVFHAAILPPGSGDTFSKDLRASDETVKQFALRCVSGSSSSACHFKWNPADFSGLAGPATLRFGSTVKDLKSDTELVASGDAVTAVATLVLGSGQPVQAKLFLAGGYAGNTLRTTLVQNGRVPVAQPYTNRHSGVEKVALFPTESVDWVLVELLDAGGTVVGQRAALVRSDGELVELDGANPVTVFGVPAGSYRLVVRHRNHVPADTDALVNWTTTPRVDFTASAGSGRYEVASGVFAQAGGDLDGDGLVTGLDALLFTSGTLGYLAADFDLNGQSETSDLLTVWAAGNGR
ncbi:MAG: hypothetical protein AAGI08_12850 [Bacteroidota bacterium]